MNRGGFSWKRLVGISALKSRISRFIGIPLTRSGRQRKLGAFIEKIIFACLGIKRSPEKTTKRSAKNYE